MGQTHQLIFSLLLRAALSTGSIALVCRAVHEGTSSYFGWRKNRYLLCGWAWHVVHLQIRALSHLFSGWQCQAKSTLLRGALCIFHLQQGRDLKRQDNISGKDVLKITKKYKSRSVTSLCIFVVLWSSWNRMCDSEASPKPQSLSWHLPTNLLPAATRPHCPKAVQLSWLWF